MKGIIFRLLSAKGDIFIFHFVASIYNRLFVCTEHAPFESEHITKPVLKSDQWFWK